MMDFSKFDSMVDVEGLKADIEKAASGQGDYVDVPHGLYEVKVTKLELTESKKGDPMVRAFFKIVNGEYEDSMIFLNQVVKKGFQLHIVNELLRSMETGIDIHFESYSKYAQLLEDVFAAIDGHKEFALEYGENKGFNTFKITDVFNI